MTGTFVRNRITITFFSIRTFTGFSKNHCVTFTFAVPVPVPVKGGAGVGGGVGVGAGVGGGAGVGKLKVFFGHIL